MVFSIFQIDFCQNLSFRVKICPNFSKIYENFDFPGQILLFKCPNFAFKVKFWFFRSKLIKIRQNSILKENI